MISFVIVDFTPGVKEDLAAIAAAIQFQVQNDFAKSPPHGCGISATVRMASSQTDVKPEEWVVGLITNPDIPGALGYHDETPAGKPYAKIFPVLSAQDGVPLSGVISHEILETLGDPNVSRCCQWSDGRFWADEKCDGVEAQHYKINGIEVSDFVLPPYFEPMTNTIGLKFDHMGIVTQPHQLLPGGYNQFWGKRGWQQITHAQQAPRSYRQLVEGRSKRRQKIH